MGLGPLCAIYQAHVNRYLLHREIVDTSGSRVWAFLGDGELDEVESIGALGVAGREHLDNLIFVVNCNLQRLDGPVRGNGKIIQEAEATFRGAGWNVIKVIWGSKWDELLARDIDGVLLDKMNTTPDGEFQKYATESGAYIREHFFGPDPRLRRLVEHLSDDELQALPRGGHDYRKLYAAYKLATEQVGTAHRDPRQDGEGMDARARDRGPQRHPPDQEDDARPSCWRCATASTSKRRSPTRPSTPSSPPTTARRRHRPPTSTSRRAARCWPAPCPHGWSGRRAGVRAPGVGLRRPVRRLGQAGGVDHDGLRPAAAEPGPRPRPSAGSSPPSSPTRPAPSASSRSSPSPRSTPPRASATRRSTPTSSSATPRTEGAGPRGGHHRGRRHGLVHRPVDGLRHLGPAHAADLPLLFDVRLPAHRRPGLAPRRHPGPRHPGRLHRGPHHPAGRGPPARRRPLPSAGVGEPRGPHLRPRLRLRDRRDHGGGGTHASWAPSPRTASGT